MDKNIIKNTVLDQRESFEKKGDFVERDVPKGFLSSKKIGVISGIRRSGKSTLLKQVAKNFGNYAYLNFEDERMLDFTYRDFNALLEVFLELYGDQETYLFDEIQNIFGWEKFVRRLFEERKKIFVTGSNAKLLSSELATALSGRHLKMELFPFSFWEYIKFKENKIKSHYTTKEKVGMENHLKRYIEKGGFPEIVVGGDAEELKQLYQDVLIKDLLVRFNIRETKAFRDVALFLLSNISSPVSFNGLRNLLGIKSVTSVKNYVDFFEEAYLFYSLFKFDYSIKKQIINDRKIYCVDTGIVNAVAFRFSENIGRTMENIVFVELKRRNCETFYFRSKKECDFVMRKGMDIVEAIQVAQTLSSQETKAREVEGLLEAMEKFKLKTGLIITQNQEGEEKIGGNLIKITPLWKWLIEK
ncbi:MAG: hypothetical protein A2359_01055 [Candidatus Moranbacteria bacterium RIFOXYB1_FULL_43_19]|nr:MAG: hypothetical protein A2359_01055 [Candidatus Moranbacteria bacterium RIFOXYB1_FULL_43_19]OGI27423.1 MAG: hypothetical protein A2184_03360 [Candidatus Moranbacteria bacterium RIFOXYA1_FULL_44_7]OGI33034.1 MAG: hypothetical protein A2420_01480 [Candidatus Moranbacteria bacterium RIFOXYC1_FULL_44_13]OGI38227.1 MAG: hypothetical protein A2612_04465 [Candidatus Moranbacteria bacterium RIFOXYD1_FULL_44_12]